MFPYQDKVYNFRFLLASQYWEPEKLEQLQLEGLKAMVSFAREHCPYYRDLPIIKDIDDINKIPVLTKTDIKKNFDNIVVKNIPHEVEETGGTISRIKVARDKILLNQLGLKRYQTWYGISHRRIVRIANLWGSVEGAHYGRKSWGGKQILWMPVEKLTNEKTAKKYLEGLKKFRPTLFKGYALPLNILAHYANKLNIHPHCHIIRSECETLTKEMRENIENAFETRGLFNFYGSRDLGGMAQDCYVHKDLHYFAERYIIENIDGRFVFTDLINYAFPLIRYENQDIGELGKACECDIKLPTIKPVIGRVLSYLKTKKGNWVTAFVFYLPINYYDIHHNTKIFGWIESFQIRQREAGKVTLLLKPWTEEAPPKDFSKMIKIINSYIKKEDFDFDLEVVDKIPLSRSGKQTSVDTTLMREWK